MGKTISNKTQGILWVLSAAFFFAAMNMFVKLAGDVPFVQKSFFRNIVAAIIALIMVIRTEEKTKLTKTNVFDLFMRSVFGTLGILCNFYAVDHINISDASLLNKLSPFYAVILSMFILKEKANKSDWMFLVIAFIGALFVIKPTFDFRSFPAFMGLLGGMMAGTAYTFLRKVGLSGVKGPIIVLFFSTCSCTLVLPYLLFNYSPMTKYQLTMLIMAGCSAALAQISITAAYTKVPAKEISVFDFSQILFAAILGALFLDQLPDRYSIIGYIIIIVTAVARWKYMLNHSEN